MNKNSIKWAASFICITFIFTFPASHHALTEFTAQHPYVMGFVKFSTLAFLGELMGIRISNGEWIKPKGPILRILAWGLMGMAIAFVLPLAYQGGVLVKEQGLISFVGDGFLNKLLQAFAASIIFNLLPGPMVILYHRLAESFIELSEGNISDLKKVRFSQVIEKVDWVHLIQFIILRVNLILFIPINTVIFYLPPNHRVLVAAYSSILLGIVLGYHKRKKKSEKIYIF